MTEIVLEKKRILEEIDRLVSELPPQNPAPINYIRTRIKQGDTIKTTELLKHFIDAGYNAEVFVKFLINIGVANVQVDMNMVRRAIDIYIDKLHPE